MIEVSGVAGFLWLGVSRFQGAWGWKSASGVLGQSPGGIWQQSPQKQNLNFRFMKRIFLVYVMQNLKKQCILASCVFSVNFLFCQKVDQPVPAASTGSCRLLRCCNLVY